MNKFFFKIVGMLTIVLALMAFSPPDNPIRKSRYKGFFGCEYTDSVQISVEEFKQLISKPLCVKDSANQLYKVENFEIMYAERGLYQDDEGLPIIVTDYSNVQCNGDTIPQNWIKKFNNQSYKGDTIYIDKVRLHTKENKLFECKSIKIVLK